MRIALGVCWVMLGAACAHGPAKPPEAPSQDSADSSQGVESVEALLAGATAARDVEDFSTCVERARQVAQAGPDGEPRAEAFYLAARCSALAGRSAEALELLGSSVRSGYADADHLQYDPELASLHALAGWPELVTAVKANREKSAEPPFPALTLRSFDIYGSKHCDPEAARRVFGLEVGKPVVQSRVLTRRAEERLKKECNLAFAHLALIGFYGGDEVGNAFATVDLVDVEDRQKLRFLPEPKGHLPDPEGLIALWAGYEERGRRLLLQGKLEGEATCVSPHCVFGFNHPDLAPLEPIFVAKVPGAADALTAVLREDADTEKRALAAFLLSYAPTMEETVRRLGPSIRDPDGGVRNNVLRVLTATQEKAEKPLLDAATIIDAASLPETTDRNKVFYLLGMWLDDLKPEALKAQRATLLTQLCPQLTAMAAMQQIINRKPAEEVLAKLAEKPGTNPCQK